MCARTLSLTIFKTEVLNSTLRFAGRTIWQTTQCCFLKRPFKKPLNLQASLRWLYRPARVRKNNSSPQFLDPEPLNRLTRAHSGFCIRSRKKLSFLTANWKHLNNRSLNVPQTAARETMKV